MSERSITMVQAVNEALDAALANDDSVFLLGEDIVDPAGGVMQVTQGLSTKYGLERVRETPISEQAIVGAAIGAAIAGFRPVAEVMLFDFLAICLDQVVNHAAKLRYMSSGRTTVPLTIRCTATGGMQFGAQHSQMVEAWLMHTPGINVVVPSTPADAKDLLTACIFDDDPCVFVEPAALYSTSGPVPEVERVVPLGVADLKRPGDDVTVVTYGRQVHDCLAAAEQVAGDVSAEVIDLRTVSPWDADTVLDSVAKTKRCVVVHQAVERCGVGAEIATVVSERRWGDLAAPVRRVAARNTPVPYAAELESAHLPSVDDIAGALLATVA